MNIKYPLLIDGGLSNQLESQGCDLNSNLWTAKLIDSDPDSIINAHLAYLEAGAGCILTSSYQASIRGFINEGFSRTEAEEMIGKTVLLADEAINRFMTGRPEVTGRPIIAASMGPYGASLSDGSEYKGNYGISTSELIDFHLQRIRIINSSRADIFAFETIPDYKEAEVLAGITKTLEKPSWISFSCRDEKHINDGTPLEKCLELFSDQPEIFALGVNCTAPEYIPDLIDILKKGSGNKKILVYPNSGEVYLPESKTWSGMVDPFTCESMGREWLKRGADIIGGCCRMGPEHILSLSKAIKSFYQ